MAPAQVAELTRLLGEIDEFKGVWRKLGEIRAERLASLRHVTTIESAGSSTRIEGAQLSDAEVAQVLQGLRVDSFRARDEGEVRGYAEVLQTIFDSHAAVPLTENYLKQLHGMLLSHVEKDGWHRGEYKKHDNHVEARHADGTVTIVFRTATPFETPARMANLIAATNAALDGGEVHPLVAIARFIVEFLAIHPFQDGNGRLSRAVTALLMLRAAYEYVPYASVERVVEENKAAYYQALRASQDATLRDPSAFGEWLLFFLRVLQSQKRTLAAKLEVERSVVRLKDVQVRMLELVEKQGRATTADVARALLLTARASRYHLGLLAQQGLVDEHGERRGRYYTRRYSPPAEPVNSEAVRNNEILAAILERGGSIPAADLLALVREKGGGGRLVGSLHGRRLAHLKRDARGVSTLTARGHEVAEQYLFSKRLSRSGQLARQPESG